LEVKNLLENLPDISMPKSIMAWLHTPGTYKSDYEEHRFHEKDDIWHHEEIFSGDRFLIETATEWYESPNVVTIYKDHKYLFNQNMNMGKPFEKFYFQNVDSNSFESVMEIDEELPSGRGDLILETNVMTKSAPSGENNFAMMDYSTKLWVKYDLPGGISFLPRFLAYPLNSIFKYYFIRHIGEEMLEYDIEYARERVIEYFDYIRKYHGEEPVQTRSRQEEFTPPWEGTFFD
jgi:hypothetical protein